MLTTSEKRKLYTVNLRVSARGAYFKFGSIRQGVLIRGDAYLIIQLHRITFARKQ